MSRRLGWAQDIPAAFWREHGVDGFNGTWYILRGPLSPWTVKSATYTFGRQSFCSFTQGWAGFCTANRLSLGDTLCFTKVGPVEFIVTKV